MLSFVAACALLRATTALQPQLRVRRSSALRAEGGPPQYDKVGATLVAWYHYGTCSGSKPSDYTPATIAVETTATRFKVSVRHTVGFNDSTGVAIFRPTGVAP